MKKAPCYIFEGTWWSNHEVPQVLPYFQALESSGGGISLSHRTIRTAEDISYYIGEINKDERAFVYFACHGRDLDLYPTDAKNPIHRKNLRRSLTKAKPNAIAFLHFSCCEMVDKKNRKDSLNELVAKDQSDIRWISGYVKKLTGLIQHCLT